MPEFDAGSKQPVKVYPTLGCCGLDCGLCPRYYTVGNSRCPGCCGLDFFNKHPSYSFVTCCVKRKNLEVCAECNEFPCSKFEGWTGEDEDIYDSFLTHKKAIPNLLFIKEYGINEFIKQQKKRVELLEMMIGSFDDGRSRSYYCIAATLLPTTSLETLLNKAQRELRASNISPEDIKIKAKVLRGLLDNLAAKEGIQLSLRKKRKD